MMTIEINAVDIKKRIFLKRFKVYEVPSTLENYINHESKNTESHTY